MWDPGVELRVSDLAASPFRHRASSQALTFDMSIYGLDSDIQLSYLVLHEVETVALSLVPGIQESLHPSTLPLSWGALRPSHCQWLTSRVFKYHLSFHFSESGSLSEHPGLAS